MVRTPWVRWAAIAAIVLLGVSSALLLGAPAVEKRVSVFSATGNYSVPVTERRGRDYVELLETLQPLGKVEAKGNSKRWKLRLNKIEGEFTPGSARAKVRKREVLLPTEFLLENGHGLLPVASLSDILSAYLNVPVTLYEASSRLLIGAIGTHFTAQLRSATPPTVALDFTAPVNPSISTEPGKLRMIFAREPVLASGPSFVTFDSKAIPSAIFQESNGAAEIVVNGTVPLFAAFSNNGRTITISAPQNTTPTSTPANTDTTPGSATSRIFAIVDASHGGDERGAALSDQLAEKDVTLGFALRLKQELESKGLRTMLLRDADSAMTLDQRATAVNKHQPAIYLCLHASSQGNGVRLYTALLPSGAGPRGPFLDWNTAQSHSLLLARSLEVNAATDLQKMGVPVRVLYAPMRPLNNVVVPALAVEVAPLKGDLRDLTSPGYQHVVASSIVSGLAVMRDKLEAAR